MHRWQSKAIFAANASLLIVAAFEKMEEKVLAMESEAEAANLLVAPDTIEKRFRELEGDSVEDDLQVSDASG